MPTVKRIDGRDCFATSTHEYACPLDMNFKIYVVCAGFQHKFYSFCEKMFIYFVEIVKQKKKSTFLKLIAVGPSGVAIAFSLVP